MAPPDCTPLGERNGRSRGLVTPSKPAVVNDNEESWTISASSATMMREKLLVELPEQRKRATAAEEKVASQEKIIQDLQSALASASSRAGQQERKRMPAVKEEKTLELANVRVELHQAQQLLDFKDSTIDRLIPQVVANSIQEKQQVKSKEAEIEHLRRELNGSRAEVAQHKQALFDTQQRLDTTEAELDRVLPGVVADRMQGRKSLNSKDAELMDARRELDSARAELAEKNFELQQARNNKNLEMQHARGKHLDQHQAHQDLELKTEEISQLRRELASTRAELSGAFVGSSTNNLQLHEALQGLEFKTTENDRLRRELDASRAECSQQLMQLQQLRNESKSSGSLSCPMAANRTRAGSKDYEEALLAMEEQELSQRSLELQRRELLVAKSEGLLLHSCIEPVLLPMRSPPVSRAPTPRRIPTASRAPTPPLTPRQQFYGSGGSGIPCRPGGSLWDRIGF